MDVVIVAKIIELADELDRVPEERTIKILAPDRSDQSFDEWMRTWDVGNGFDLLDLEPVPLASQRWKRNNGSWSVLSRFGLCSPTVAQLNIRQTETPSMYPRSTPDPTMRRVKTS